MVGLVGKLYFEAERALRQCMSLIIAATEYAYINEYDNVCYQLDDARLALRISKK
jgi:hypothetical protein